MSVNGTEVSAANELVVDTRFTVSELRNVETWQDAIALLQNKGIEVHQASDVLGDGFALVDSKSKRRLVGVPFIILSYSFVKSEKIKGKEFVTVRLVTRNNERLIINDGSTGVYEQLKMCHESGIESLFVTKGLRVSEYEYTDPNSGEVSQAETYYLDNSASV